MLLKCSINIYMLGIGWGVMNKEGLGCQKWPFWWSPMSFGAVPSVLGSKLINCSITIFWGLGLGLVNKEGISC